MDHKGCAICGVNACGKGDLEAAPEFCPMRSGEEALGRAREAYAEPEVNRQMVVAASVEKRGYRVWPRVREVIEFAKSAGIKRIGVAFCVGLRQEVRSLVEILDSHGFEVESVVCCVGGFDKADLGIAPEHRFSAEGFEAACNPIGQAMLLNAAGTELNVAVGLCVGHDALFCRFSHAPVTTLVAKDRVTCHNPAGPLLNSYWRGSLKADAGGTDTEA